MSSNSSSIPDPAAPDPDRQPADNRNEDAVVARIRCQDNLRQIQAAIRLYAEAHGGALPRDLDEIVQMNALAPDVFVCPVAPDTPAYALAPALPLRWDALTPEHILLYEPAATHQDPYTRRPGQGMNVALGPGRIPHAHWLDGPEAARVRESLAGGINPPRKP